MDTNTGFTKLERPTPPFDTTIANPLNPLAQIIEDCIDEENISELEIIYKMAKNTFNKTPEDKAFLDYIDKAILYTEQEWLASK